MQDKAIYHEGGAPFVEDEGGEIKNPYPAVVLESEILQVAQEKAKNGKYKLSGVSLCLATFAAR